MNNKRYELVASNGQVLEHGFEYYIDAKDCMLRYLDKYENENFSIREYEKGKYEDD